MEQIIIVDDDTDDENTTPAENDFDNNDSMQYAALRNIMLRKGKAVEILCDYEPSLHYTLEWWKQLMGESEGKDNKGLFPASVDLTTDLHSMGQFIQDGSRIMFETVLNVEKASIDKVLANAELLLRQRMKTLTDLIILQERQLISLINVL